MNYITQKNIIDAAVKMALAGDFGEYTAERVAYCKKMRDTRLSLVAHNSTDPGDIAATDMQAAMNDAEERLDKLEMYVGFVSPAAAKETGKVVANFFGDIGALKDNAEKIAAAFVAKAKYRAVVDGAYVSASEGKPGHYLLQTTQVTDAAAVFDNYEGAKKCAAAVADSTMEKGVAIFWQ